MHARSYGASSPAVTSPPSVHSARGSAFANGKANGAKLGAAPPTPDSARAGERIKVCAPSCMIL